MFTVILIVVLCGTAGLLALALIDGQETSAAGGDHDVPSLRARAAGDTSVAPAGDRAPRLHLGLPELGPAVGDPEGVPARYRAVEGTYAEVAVAPWWRRLLALAAVSGIVAVAGITVAAVFGGLIGAVAELLDGAIG